MLVAGNTGKERIEEVVAFAIERTVIHVEYFQHLARCSLYDLGVFGVDDNSEGEFAEVIALEFQLL